MSNDNFVKVFDIMDSGFKNWFFFAFGLHVVAMGIIIIVFPKIIKARGVPNLYFNMKYHIPFGYTVIGFGILWTAVTFFSNYPQHLRHKALVQQNRCSVVEGPVEHFVPMPYGGHAQESFVVAGIPFKYSDFFATDAFNNASSHGGPIKADSHVRICYDPSENAILRLEIRDFKGEVKDYSRIPSFFAPPLGILKNLPWYVLVAVYALDLLGLYVLSVPYLRTFFRLKSETLRDCRMSRILIPGRKSKLRNSMIYCDVETGAIWVRARGLNFIAVPLMVGRLNIDARSKSIVGTEIRLSSSFPLVIALLFWTAYSIASTVLPPNADSNSAFLFSGSAIFLIAVIVNLSIIRSRMWELLQDAISELEGN